MTRDTSGPSLRNARLPAWISSVPGGHLSPQDSRARVMLLIVTAVWVYVALSDTLYASSMRWIQGGTHIFVPLKTRLLQHLLLYPLLLLCMWGSLALGWRPIRPRVLLQALLAAGFAVLAYPAMELGLWLTGGWPAILYLRPSFALDPTHSAMFQTQAHAWLATTVNFLLRYGFALTLVSGFEVYRELRDAQIRSAALERSLTTANLASLRMQLSPHSLFNLLHTIRGQIEWDPIAASTMIVQLGEVLRRLLNASEREFSVLCDEIQFAQVYLELQQQRFGDRLTVEAPASTVVPAAWVPSLILQPLVENAVVHGLAGHAGPVTVSVAVAVSDEVLTMRVTNTVATTRPGRPDGIGLRNVRDRLAIHFGESASLVTALDSQGRWVAEIRMPYVSNVLEPDTAPNGSRAVLKIGEPCRMERSTAQKR